VIASRKASSVSNQQMRHPMRRLTQDVDAVNNKSSLLTCCLDDDEQEQDGGDSFPMKRGISFEHDEKILRTKNRSFFYSEV